MRIAVIGTGYVGLVSGTCFAEFGHQVTCVDKDDAKIAKLRQGQSPIYEPGLDELLARQIAGQRIAFTADLKEAVAQAEVVFIAVGTPPRASDGHADLSQAYQAAREIAQSMEGYTVVVTKSTVPVGTSREIERIIREVRPDADFDMASNPEFLREGAAINDFMHPDRVVVGIASERAKKVMQEVYRPLFLNETPIVFTGRETAEIIKYAANAFLATKISFINEIANLCEKAGADVQDVARAIGMDNRIGKKFLNAGPGYGGSCFPKDTLALVQTGEVLNAPQRIVEAVVQANADRQRAMAERIIKACGGDVSGKRIGVLGVAFKPETDDVREAPALTIIPLLQQAGATVAAYDPVATEQAQKFLQDVVWCEDAYAVAEGADVVVIITEWNQFRAMDLQRLGSAMKQKIMIDLRNIYKPAELEGTGFYYSSIGRPDVTPDTGAREKLRSIS